MSQSEFKLFVFGVFVVVFGLSEAVSNYNHEQNQITEQERRGADKDKQALLGDVEHKSDTRKRALFSIGSKHSFTPSSSGHSGYGSSGTGYGHGYSVGGGGSSGFSSSGTGYGGHHGYHSNQYLPPTGVEHSGGHGGGVGHHGHGIHSSLALKGLLIPIAGIALLGAAAALSTNPVLLQLGVINGRRKRSVEQVLRNVYPKNPVVRPENV